MNSLDFELFFEIFLEKNIYDKINSNNIILIIIKCYWKD